jgi:hypothetical protein
MLSTTRAGTVGTPTFVGLCLVGNRLHGAVAAGDGLSQYERMQSQRCWRGAMVPYRADQVFAVVHDVFCCFAAAIRITLTALPV